VLESSCVESLQRSRLKKICFIFVPGHAGVREKERADRLAGMATVESDRVIMDRAEVLNALREAGRVNDSSDENFKSNGVPPNMNAMLEAKEDL
jgi:hypothetical protein